VDIWSVGCILAELLTTRTLFPGKDALHQLDIILSVVGKPSPELLARMTSREACTYIESRKVPDKRDLKVMFQGHEPEAVDLLERMLDLDPTTRISATEALAHGYMQKYADVEDEPACEVKYQDSHTKGDIETWRHLVFEAVNSFVPPQAVDDNMNTNI